MAEEKRSGWKDAAEGKALNGETPIQNAYSFSCIKRSSGSKAEVESYEKSIKELGDFKTVQGFWRIYNHLVRPNDLPNTMDYHLFKTEIKPMWEDPANRKGGKWMVRVRKGIASRYWEDLVLAIIGEQFDVGNEICGAVVSIRYTEDIISLWNRNADNNEACYRIRDTMRKVLNLPQFVSLEYKRHDASLGDSTGNRNTTTNTSTNSNTANSNSNNNGNNSSNNSNAWRGSNNERSTSAGGNEERRGHRDGGLSRSNSSQDRSGSNSRFARGERSDRSGGERGGDRSSGNSSNSRGDSGRGGSRGDAWSRDNKRPIFTKTGGDSSEGSSNNSSRAGGDGSKKPAPSSSTTNAWGQK